MNSEPSDSEMLAWLLQDAYVAECFTSQGRTLEIAGTDRPVPRPLNLEPYTVRDAIKAAILTKGNSV